MKSLYNASKFFTPLSLSALLCISSPGEISAEITPFVLKQMPLMSRVYHPVSTTNQAAQKHFDSGLANIFAFNHDQAFQEFEKAAQLDPKLAMAYWGMALALGQNINSDVTPENEIRCYELSQVALKLSPKSSANEQAYIQALVTRYTNDPSADLVALRYKYRVAMKKVVSEYFEDLDAACLYAESILNLTPWDYWTWDGKAKAGTMETIEVLESVLKRNPEHLGANHYIIHAWEGSLTPERALLSAYRLVAMAPEFGHLLHMPCHIFLLVGDYSEAIKTSKNAIAADRKYIQSQGMQGDYPLPYLSHNLYVLIHCYTLTEDYANALRTTHELSQHVGAYLEKMPQLAQFSMVPLEVYLYFHRWKELLDYKMPKIQSPYAQAYWHFSRAMAFANLGQPEAAEKEKKLMQQAKLHFQDDEVIANNSAAQVFKIAELSLNATLAEIQGRLSKQMEYLAKAVEIQDRLLYNEPPPWYIPMRSKLGKALLKQERFPEASKAFETALKQLQRNGRLLFGLNLSLKGQGLYWNAFWVQQEMDSALKHAVRPLTLDDL